MSVPGHSVTAGQLGMEHRHNSCCAGLQYQPLQRRPYHGQFLYLICFCLVDFQTNIYIQYLVSSSYMDKTECRTRCVDGTPPTEVTLSPIWYIHPPNHGYTKITVMVVNDQLKPHLFHVNRPYHSWDKALSILTLKSQVKSSSWVWSKGKSHSWPSIQ